MSVPNRFDYVQYDEAAEKTQLAFKLRFMEVEEMVQRSFPSSGAGRYRALALTALEEAYAWVGKAIREEQIERNVRVPLQEARTNS